MQDFNARYFIAFWNIFDKHCRIFKERLQNSNPVQQKSGGKSAAFFYFKLIR
jgi:hypothetical protein